MELYSAPQYTVAARGGYQWVDGTNGSINTGVFGSVDLSWYATPDFMLRVGGEYAEGAGGAVTAGIEMQRGLGGLSLFADGALGDDQYRALAGFRHYFGTGDKHLIERHRYDDPENLVTDSLSGFMNTYLQ